jgi:hypothetical protein
MFSLGILLLLRVSDCSVILDTIVYCGIVLLSWDCSIVGLLLLFGVFDCWVTMDTIAYCGIVLLSWDCSIVGSV